MDNTAEPPPLVWRSLALRMALVVVPGWFVLAVLIFSIPWFIKLLVASVLLTSLVNPAAGLLAVAALAPVGQLLAQLAGLEKFRVGEALVLAFLIGWLLRGQRDRQGPALPPIVGWLFAAAIAASVGGLAVQAWTRRPGELAETVDFVIHLYFQIQDRLGFVDGARLLEGIALTAATVTLFRQRPRLAAQLPVALAASATLAAAASLLLWRGIGPASMLERYARIGFRVSAHVGDVNAAGSHFAMILCLALGMMLHARGRGRALWIVAVMGATVGLWFSESRTGMAAAAITIAAGAGWLATAAWRPKIRLAAFAAILVLAVGLGAVRAHLLERDPTYRGAGFRTQFNETSLRMIAARPIFGIGVGQYYRTSPLFLSPELAWSYGFENAHNFFLQIAAELGVLGFALFAAWTGISLWRAMRALIDRPRDTRLLGATAGVVAMLGTCLTSHPLLIDEVAIPFWIQFGLMAGLAGSVLLNAAPALRAARAIPRSWQLAAAAAAVSIVVSAPVSAARGEVEPAVSEPVDGFYGWETANDGARFRWTERFASLFVPGDVKRASIPVRLTTAARGVAPMGVEVMVAGNNQGRSVVGETWTTISVPLEEIEPQTRFKRIDLKIDHTWQPALYIAGNADLRMVGVQVGEPELIR